MDFTDEPPSKKRRFLADHLDSDHVVAGPSSSPQGYLLKDIDTPVATPQAVTPPVAESPQLAFDKDTFEAFVGEKVAIDILHVISKNCGNDIERAVNMYLDGTWKKLHRAPPVRVNSHSPLVVGRQSPKKALTTPQQARSKPQAGETQFLPSMPEARYVGAFGVEGWATRSGTGLLRHGDIVKIERQKIQPPTVARKGQTKPGTPQSIPRVSAAAAKRVDVIVRFTDASGRELGRLAKDTANWVSTLIDQKVCRFEGICVYAPERLRTNETVFLQLKCYILRSAFFGRTVQLADNRAAGFHEKDETTEEKELRLRQVALVRLFQEINLVPSRGNAAAARDVRKELLEAAEMAEKKAMEHKAKAGDNNNGSASPSEEAEEGQELQQDQLDALYKKAQSFDFDTPEAEPADTFAMTLRPYQKQSLYWMLAKEKNQRTEDRETSMHPLWEEYTWPLKDHDDKDLPVVPDQPHFYVNPYSGDLSLDFPKQEQHCLGGILADEMGLGKTIQMLSLIHSHRSEAAIKVREAGPTSVNNLPRLPAASGQNTTVDAPCTTLVVAPMSLLAQWQSEAENASKEGTLKIMMYYGTEKNVDLLAMCCEANAANAPDVIVTSYGVVLSEFTQLAAKNADRLNSRGLFSLNFFRVILDEAHNIKNRQAKTSRACYEIAAEHRWVLTGTPIVNRLEDLFSLVRFLRVEPWNNFSFWKTFITVPFESKNFVRALDVVQTVLEPLVMRRTKGMKTPDGQFLVPLPPKHIEIVDIELSEPERAVYDYVFKRAKRTFFDNMQAGTVMKAFTSIFAQILRLRQTCCHPLLVRNQEILADEEEANMAADVAAGLADDMDLQSLIERFTATTDDASTTNNFGAHVLKQIRDEAVNECPICAEEPMIDQAVTGCWHSACKKCLLDYIKHQTDRNEVPRCFQCREHINIRDIFEVIRHDDDPETPSISTPGASPEPRISLQRAGANDSSAKIVALISHLRALRQEHPKMKSLVISQFTSFLTLISAALARHKIAFLRLDGSMSQKARAAVLTEFQSTDKFCVLLLSLKAGGVGLNLTSAKRVYMMDPWWSFAVEAQAIDRVHRMGQEDEVRVYRFIVKQSVEMRMLRVQERKKFIATSLGMMSDEEKKMQRIEDIKELLSSD
ncbi:SNF2 family N-terminal domain-containing protein [Pseudoneurospora amorphoporcata]|uniref:SNF2 family N-terminal domain-containing protein n=1 Tax=Pseudoneurospora amorphoporcata TaxID=241081 RepID=A0AAN6SFY6_9PEZI|nr:SNF2 family N-terminal domain-containing protein [Pseudoneurospora amorphoporcata]